MTPLRQQYLRIKKQFHARRQVSTIVFIVMFRLGDFYETFDDDAKTVSSVCNIVLTGPEMGTGNRASLAGVPYNAVDNYLAKLIQAGLKVAIVEQTGTLEKVAGVPGRVFRNARASAQREPSIVHPGPGLLHHFVQGLGIRDFLGSELRLHHGIVWILTHSCSDSKMTP